MKEDFENGLTRFHEIIALKSSRSLAGDIEIYLNYSSLKLSIDSSHARTCDCFLL